uniref:DUF3618 domain-containing protein n=1 Tax=Knipowitschia caucasica TaxID=637954 RepID=A0AAV2JMU1_KNICA
MGTQTDVSGMFPAGQRSEDGAASDPLQAQLRVSDLRRRLDDSDTQLRQLETITSERDESIRRLRDQEQAVRVEPPARMEESDEVPEVEVENGGGFWSTFRSGAKKVVTASLWAVPAVVVGYGIYSLTC